MKEEEATVVAYAICPSVTRMALGVEVFAAEADGSACWETWS